VTGLVVAPERPDAPDVLALLDAHLALMHEQTPPEDVHALDVTSLLAPEVTFLAARRFGSLVGVGALKRLDPLQYELKSMHVAATARGSGVGRALLVRLLDEARAAGAARVLLETGATPPFAAARQLYVSAGFVPCGPFGDYAESPHSAFFAVDIGC
jgi:putative acetyltransferase